MGYRDELEATRARIVQLEQELEALRHLLEKREVMQRNEPVAVVPTIRERLVRLRAAERRIAELESGANAELEALKATMTHQKEELDRKLVDAERRIATLERGMPTITVHNRGQTTDVFGTLAGVMCPMCWLLGERVEMVFSPELHLAEPQWGGMKTATCPRCLLLHLLRIEASDS